MTWFRHMRSLVCLTLLTMGRQEGGAVAIIAYTGRRCLKGVPLSGFGYIGITLVEVSSSETQGQSVGSREKARRKVLSTGGFFHPGLEKNEWNEWRYNSVNYALRDQVAKKKYQPLSQQWSLPHVAVLSRYANQPKSMFPLVSFQGIWRPTCPHWFILTGKCLLSAFRKRATKW